MGQIQDAKYRHQEGLSGWLSPKGVFIHVNYGEHDAVARNMEMNNEVELIHNNELNYSIAHGERLLELSGYIKFTCRMPGADICEAYVFFPQQFGCRNEITDSQIEWLESNYNRMAAIQKSYVNQFLRYAYGREYTTAYGF